VASITYSIPDEKIADFKRAFLKCHPIPVDEKGNPEMTELNWIKKWGRDQFILVYKIGMRQLAADIAKIDNEIITRV